MATITFNPLVAVDFTTLNLTRSAIDTTNAIAYDFDTSDGTDIDVECNGFTYDTGNNLPGGTISRIDIDIASNQGAINGGDINISGLAITNAIDLAAIDNGAFSMLGIALQGNDTFLLAGLSKDADTPVTTNRLFGDDLANIILFVIGGTNTNTGGSDLFSGADNRLEVAMDVWDLSTSASFAISSTYTGGNDTFLGTISAEFAQVAGDAWTITRAGVGQMTLIGGDDTIDLTGNSSGSSWIAGDVNEMRDGVVIGGNDAIDSDNSATPEVAGDVRTYSGGTLTGGDDVISAVNSARIGGDVMFLDAPVPAGVFTITGGADEISGGAGDDIIGGDVYDRNSVVDNLIVGGDDVLFGGAGNDDLFGEIVFGDGSTGVSGGDDVIFGGAGNDELRGQTGDDLLDGGIGNDTIDGGVGDDTVSFATARGGVAVNLLVVGAQNTIGAGVDVIFDVENLTGSRYDDTLRGNNFSNEINGGQGNDLIFSGAGSDDLYGGMGNDRLNAVGQSQDVLHGGAGDDVLESSGGGNLLIGGVGIDTVSFALVGDDSTIDLVLGQARRTADTSGDLLFQIENATGGGGNDAITGTEGANVLVGLAGRDRIFGSGGDDIIDGGADGDDLRGGGGNDVISGGDGIDRIFAGGGNDLASGGEGGDTIAGESGNDTLNGEAGNDTLSGGRNDDILNGGDGNDTLDGDENADVLNGGIGNDTLNGGADNDVLIGGAGIDIYTGGGGADILVFSPTAGNVLDIVTDFTDTGAISDDIIDVRGYGFTSVASITATRNGNDVLLNFGDGDRVRLVGYLLTNQLGDIDASDFLI